MAILRTSRQDWTHVQMHLVEQVPTCGPQRLWVTRGSSLEKVWRSLTCSKVSNVDRMNPFSCIYAPSLLSLCRCRSSLHLTKLQNSLHSYAFMYFFEIHRKITTANVRGQNSSIQKNLSLSPILTRVHIKTGNHCCSGNTDSKIIKSRRKLMVWNSHVGWSLNHCKLAPG